MVPIYGITWTITNTSVRWCLFACLKDEDCVSIFFNSGTCHGYPEKIHDMIEIRQIYGTSYYEIAGPMGNVAAGKTAIQSSNYGLEKYYGPALALDAVRHPYQNDPDISRKSCSHTRSDADNFPFWQVDLDALYLVFLNITVAETANGPRHLCMYYPGPGFMNQMKTFYCETPVKGQFVRISRDERVLNMCELEVYGFPLH
ncbi:uncharacterized protein LOC132546668 [Ylistrum balloti]|uniref:uncharacterized protein LOC132546668 n=1 Tax=Ylistrum balloti TaxID=509963 RepID=UPI002905E794|nr:uncharacterized protein LOC132546668 [Ylistrum balloti]